MTIQESFLEKNAVIIMSVGLSAVVVIIGAYGFWSAQLNSNVVHTAVMDKVSDRSGTYCVFEASDHHRYKSYNTCLFSIGEEGTFQQYNGGTWKAINP